MGEVDAPAAGLLLTLLTTKKGGRSPGCAGPMRLILRSCMRDHLVIPRLEARFGRGEQLGNRGKEPLNSAPRTCNPVEHVEPPAVLFHRLCR